MAFVREFNEDTNEWERYKANGSFAVNEPHNLSKMGTNAPYG